MTAKKSSGSGKKKGEGGKVGAPAPKRHARAPSYPQKPPGRLTTKEKRELSTLSVAAAGAADWDDLHKVPDPGTLEGRVTQIVSIMASGNWVTGQSHRAIMEAWGQSLTVVQNIAAQASRAIRLLTDYDEDPSGLRATFAARIARIGQLSLEKTRPITRTIDGEMQVAYTPDPDFSSALRAAELEARLMGFLKTGLEVSGPDGGPVAVEHTAIVVLPAQNGDGTPPALDTHGETVEPAETPEEGNGAD